LALELIATLSVALIAVTIGLRLIDGNISLQTGLFVLILAPEVYWPIRQVATHFHAATDGVEAADQIFNILGDKEVVDKVKIQKFDFIIWSDLIVEFENRSKVKVPAGRIENKAVNLIVGPSGAGKSTLIQILLGFQENYSGDVWVKDGENSINLKDIDKQSWQKLISWMPQEPHFPVLSVLNTLQLADPKQSTDQLLGILETVGLDLSQLPQAEQTKLGTLLEQLSIGQKRKIALARALIKPAQLLILDEPTASVDIESQERIDNLIRTSAQNGQMVLVVSHRSQSLLTADSVLDFDNRVVV
jgi:ABC-type transport system involved in cytochrome bd biosynthesis fused ATPase/permease subunit